MDTALARPLAAGFSGAHWYKRVQAWMAAQGSPRYERLVAGTKSALLSPLEGTVLEIGPGGGANLPFLRGDVRWIGVEPNPFAHPYLHDAADRLGLDAEVRLGTAERLPVSDRSVDAVIGSLVLCSVRDPAAALREVRRVLRPGGRYVFVEHVAAHHGRPLRFLQRLMRPVWRAMGDGCHPDRDTGALIAAAGFAGVVQRPFELPIPVVGPHVAGLAWV
jgi:ubiquinone/menaquinone biosynthesis C-methylase UbiE